MDRGELNFKSAPYLNPPSIICRQIGDRMLFGVSLLSKYDCVSTRIASRWFGRAKHL